MTRRPPLRTRDFLALSTATKPGRYGYGPTDRAELAERFPAEDAAVLEIQVRSGGPWVKVDPWIFRSWTGPRRVNGEVYAGDVFLLGSGTVA